MSLVRSSRSRKSARARASAMLSGSERHVARSACRGGHGIGGQAEFSGHDAASHRIHAVPGAFGDSLAQRGIEDQIDNLFTHPENDDTRLECLVAHLAGDVEKSVRQVDRDAAEYHVGRDTVLIRVAAEDIRALRLACRLEDAESRSVGILEYDVDATRDLRERLLLPRADVVPVTDIRRCDANAGVDLARAGGERAKALANRR